MIKNIGFFLLIPFSFIIGMFVEKNFDTTDINVPDLRSQLVRQAGYKYISPLLECEQVEGLGGPNFIELESNLSSYIEDRQNEGTVSDVAVYFREFKNGAWFGIGNTDEYSPASLLKVPIMLTYFKQAEDNPEILERESVFEGNPAVKSQEYDPRETLEVGKTYKNIELIERMIKFSDNNALFLLGQSMPGELVDKLMHEMGVKSGESISNEDYNISVIKYASFFRILYNASYLTKDYSEKALALLADTDFDKGIRRGVPKEVEIAHKFGERDIVGSGTKQLHDCGIVYHPKGNYLLCVMTRGVDYDALSDTIGEISKKTFEAFSKAKEG